jgi:hypothetical protein
MLPPSTGQTMPMTPSSAKRSSYAAPSPISSQPPLQGQDMSQLLLQDASIEQLKAVKSFYEITGQPPSISVLLLKTYGGNMGAAVHEYFDRTTPVA